MWPVDKRVGNVKNEGAELALSVMSDRARAVLVHDLPAGGAHVGNTAHGVLGVFLQHNRYKPAEISGIMAAEIWA